MSATTNNTGPFGGVQDVTMQNAAAAPANGTVMNVGNQAGVCFQTTGTATGLSLSPEVSQDGANWKAIAVVPLDSSSPPVTAVTGFNVYWAPVQGCDQFRVRIAAISTGNVTVIGKAVIASGGTSITNLAPLPIGSNTIGAVTQASGPWTVNVTQIGGTTLSLGQAAMTASIPVVLASNQSNVPTNTVQYGGNNVLTGGSNGSVGVGGLAASASSYVGNPIAIGGEFLAWGSLPAATTGQAVSLIADAAGTLKVGSAVLGTPLYGTASSGGAAAANVTLTIPAAKMGFLDGFDLDGLGATAGSAISVSIVGLLGGTLTFTVGIPAGATVPFTMSKRFNPPLQASAVNTNIVVNVPSFGTGNTASTNNVYGHYI